MQERAIVYIDGFNLYFGLRESTGADKKQTKRSYWLDLQRLAENIVQNRQLVAVKYFTARIKGNSQKVNRQNIFLDAIHWHCKNVKIFEGRYLLRQVICQKCHHVTTDIMCPRCHSTTHLPEEKKSDVNIATQMLKDAYENLFDTAYLISADSDLVPPIEVVRAMNPSKRVIVFFPPQRFSQELKETADAQFFLKFSTINKSLLPDVIKKPNGTIVIPAEWKN
jgi:uncharacterized LabA/DUF88 family protein